MGKDGGSPGDQGLRVLPSQQGHPGAPQALPGHQLAEPPTASGLAESFLPVFLVGSGWSESWWGQPVPMQSSLQLPGAWSKC